MSLKTTNLATGNHPQAKILVRNMNVNIVEHR